MFVLTLDFHDHLTAFHFINISHSIQSLNKTKIHQLQTWYALNVTKVVKKKSLSQTNTLTHPVP
jgi:hypothetical protein